MFEEVLKKSKKEKKVNMKSKLADSDPIMKLGYGITAYRNIMWAMIVLFGVLTLLSIPAILIYKSGEGYHLSLAKTVGRA